MKKKSAVILVLFLIGLSLRAQSFDEWFRQHKTQIKYLVSQIEALELFDGNLDKGYQSTADGLSGIYRYKKEEFDLHQEYFHSLRAINPAVAGYGRIADILSSEEEIIGGFRQVLQSKNMTVAEMDYLQAVYSNMMNECTKTLDALTDVITTGTYTMADDERIRRIDSLYADIRDKSAFAQSFTSEVRLLAGERTAEQNDIDMSLINNGPK